MSHSGHSLSWQQSMAVLFLTAIIFWNIVNINYVKVHLIFSYVWERYNWESWTPPFNLYVYFQFVCSTLLLLIPTFSDFLNHVCDFFLAWTCFQMVDVSHHNNNSLYLPLDIMSRYPGNNVLCCLSYVRALVLNGQSHCKSCMLVLTDFTTCNCHCILIGQIHLL